MGDPSVTSREPRAFRDLPKLGAAGTGTVMARHPRIILLGEDGRDPDAFAAHLAAYLSDVGYAVETGPPAHPSPLADLIVYTLPDGGAGLDGLRRLRDASAAAILALAPRPDLVARVAGLETGADDVVVLPVDPQELAARIAGILGRRGVGWREVARFERSTVDLRASCLLRPGEKPERLGPGEVALVRALVRHPHRVLSRDDLVDMAPAESLDVNDRAIDTRMARLRRKLDTDAIVTVRRRGYMFVPPFERGGG